MVTEGPMTKLGEKNDSFEAAFSFSVLHFPKKNFNATAVCICLSCIWIVAGIGLLTSVQRYRVIKYF